MNKAEKRDEKEQYFLVQHLWEHIGVLYHYMEEFCELKVMGGRERQVARLNYEMF